MIAFPHYVHLLLAQLSADFQRGVSLSEREELLTDAVHIVWARSDSRLFCGGWS